MKILVTGGSSMVGKHLKSFLPNAIYLSSSECDLRNLNDTYEVFKTHKPDAIIHLAAKVGGILDNINDPVGFFDDNIYMNTNVIKCAHALGIKKVISVLSTCIYPDVLSDDNYPIKEEYLHLGPPTKTNFAYGYAKRCMAVQMDAYNEQFNTSYSYLIPCNLYSEHDHFEGNKSHFVSSLIKKIFTAKSNNQEYIELFGSGNPLRQFMYAEDLAKAIALTLENEGRFNYNVCTPENLSIKQIAEIALVACDAGHLKILWDKTKPDGQFRKDASSDKFLNDYPNFQFTPLSDGIKKTFLKKFNETLETQRF
jgi:GDP-L-fucose synthase